MFLAHAAWMWYSIPIAYQVADGIHQLLMDLLHAAYWYREWVMCQDLLTIFIYATCHLILLTLARADLQASW